MLFRLGFLLSVGNRPSEIRIRKKTLTFPMHLNVKMVVNDETAHTKFWLANFSLIFFLKNVTRRNLLLAKKIQIEFGPVFVGNS